MSDFDEFYGVAKEQIEDMELTLPKALEKSYEKRLDIANELKNRCKSANENIQFALNEIRMMPGDLARESKTQVDDLARRLQQIQVDIGQLKTVRADEDPSAISTPVQQLSDMQKVQIASVVYDDAKMNLNEADRNLDEVIVINNNITDVLQRDLETLNRVNENLIGIQAENALAKKQLRKLAVQVTSNKCYTAIFFLVVLVIVGLSVWDIVKSIDAKKKQ